MSTVNIVMSNEPGLEKYPQVVVESAKRWTDLYLTANIMPIVEAVARMDVNGSDQLIEEAQMLLEPILGTWTEACMENGWDIYTFEHLGTKFSVLGEVPRAEKLYLGVEAGSIVNKEAFLEDVRRGEIGQYAVDGNSHAHMKGKVGAQDWRAEEVVVDKATYTVMTKVYRPDEPATFFNTVAESEMNPDEFWEDVNGGNKDEYEVNPNEPDELEEACELLANTVGIERIESEPYQIVVTDEWMAEKISEVGGKTGRFGNLHVWCASNQGNGWARHTEILAVVWAWHLANGTLQPPKALWQ